MVILFTGLTDQKGEGVAVYVKDGFEVTVLLSESVVKKYELFALNLIVSKDLTSWLLKTSIS